MHQKNNDNNDKKMLMKKYVMFPRCWKHHNPVSFVRLWACAVLALHPRGGVSFSLSSRQSLYVPDLHRDRQLRRHNLRAQYPKLQLIIRGRPKLGLGLMKRGLTDRERRKKDEAKQQEDILLDGCPDGTLGLCQENTVVKEGKMKCMKK